MYDNTICIARRNSLKVPIIAYQIWGQIVITNFNIVWSLELISNTVKISIITLYNVLHYTW
jgi:hypothetical protein